MTIELKYSPGERIKFFSPDCNRELTGTIEDVIIEVKRRKKDFDYKVIADDEIKSSFDHYIKDVHILEKL